MTAPTMLRDYVREYALRHELSPHTREQFTLVVGQFEKFTRGKSLGEIEVDDLNRWTVSLLARLERATVHSKTGRIRTLLKAACRSHKRGPFDDGEVRKVKVPRKPVRAFTPAEVRILLAQAEKVKGWFKTTGLKRCDFWCCFIRLAWDTCFRLGDLRSVRFTDLREEGHVITKTVKKTGRVYTGRLRDETWELVQRLRRQGDDTPDKLILPWLSTREAFYKAFRDLCADAGIKGSTKLLRRARATYEYRRSGGNASVAARVLHHADGTGVLAMRNYVDVSQATEHLPLPPPIADPEEPKLPETLPSLNGNGHANGAGPAASGA